MVEFDPQGERSPKKDYWSILTLKHPDRKSSSESSEDFKDDLTLEQKSSSESSESDSQKDHQLSFLEFLSSGRSNSIKV